MTARTGSLLERLLATYKGDLRGVRDRAILLRRIRFLHLNRVSGYERARQGGSFAIYRVSQTLCSLRSVLRH